MQAGLAVSNRQTFFVSGYGSKACEIKDACNETVFEGGKGAARQCKRLLEGKGLLADEAQDGKITFLNSDESKIPLCKQMFFYKG